ncbi:phosphocarrier protein HPr [Stappia sp. 22II-S9-Z10]|nr:phosphocarrier protein HPr [Stappia sp. 22II-S9-Z10]
MSGDEAAGGGAAEPRRLTLTLVNRRGLHARAAAKFVRELEFFRADVAVSRDGQSVDGRSIMGLLMLGAPCGSAISLIVTGPEADAAADALTALITDGFGERD